MKEKSIIAVLFAASAILWIGATTAVVLSYFFPVMVETRFWQLLLSFLLYVAVVLHYRNNKLMVDRLAHKWVEDNWTDCLADTPRIVKILSLLSFGYMLVVGITQFIALREGRGEIVNGTYYLWDYRIIREITEAEYQRLSLARAQFYTCFFPAANSLPLQYFSMLMKKMLRRNEVTPGR